MSKQWLVVLIVLMGLGIGAFAITEFGPDVGRIEVGAQAPNFRAIDLGTGDSVSLRERYAGKVTLVNIWATGACPARSRCPRWRSSTPAPPLAGSPSRR